MLLLSVFAAGAFVITTVGMYGVVSFAVCQRTREIGIRMAVNTQAGDVLWSGDLAGNALDVRRRDIGGGVARLEACSLK
ncbi:MAG: hypothetical protein J2P21_18625 [Chloracidobacterium sp.]|nr:hypothetical protein [Chloracidobacterium sp.]